MQTGTYTRAGVQARDDAITIVVGAAVANWIPSIRRDWWKWNANPTTTATTINRTIKAKRIKGTMEWRKEKMKRKMHWRTQCVYLSIKNPSYLTLVLSLSVASSLSLLFLLIALYGVQNKHAQQYALLIHMIRFVVLNAYMNYEFFLYWREKKLRKKRMHAIGFFSLTQSHSLSPNMCMQYSDFLRCSR